jgi:Flp pilus assembly protein TadD
VAWWLAALVFWILALGSKENAVVLPLVVVTYEWCFHRASWHSRLRKLLTGPPARTATVTLVSVVIVALVFAGLFMYVGANPVSLFRELPARDFNGYERLLTQSRVHLLYLGLLLWPSPARLNLDHDFAVSRALLVPPATLVAVLFWISVIVLAIYLCLRRPRYGFPLLAYFELHLVESGPVNLELVFEHRMYLPLTMLVLLGAVVLVDLRGSARRVAPGVALAAAVVLALATHSRNEVWADPVTLHQDIARKSPQKMRTHVNLGAALLNAGRAEEAFTAFQRALELSPNSYASHIGLGNAHLELDRPADALTEYQEAARIAPDQFEAPYNIGLALKAQGKLEEAAEYYTRVGTRLGMAGRAHEALRFLAKAVELRPESSANHNSLGNAYLMAGLLEQALEEYRQAVVLDSSNAEAIYNTGMTLEQLGRPDEAETHYRRFVEIAPPGLAPQAEQLRQRFGIPRRTPEGNRP